LVQFNRDLEVTDTVSATVVREQLVKVLHQQQKTENVQLYWCCAVPLVEYTDISGRSCPKRS